jgi:MFS family permease
MDDAAKQPSLRRYLIAQTTYFASGAMSGLLYQWLLTHDLHEDEATVGIAQALGTVPTMLLVLAGGAAADGRDLRKYVAQLQLMAAMAPILLGMFIALHQLSLAMLIVYGVSLATIAAFIMPARDALLFYVAPDDIGLSRTVALATAATFGGQLAGTLIAGTASVVGPVALFSLQAALLAIAAIATGRLRLAREHPMTTSGRPQFRIIVRQVQEGIAVAWAHERLRTVILLVMLGTPLFNGVFLVGFALLNRDYYGGGSATLAGMPLAFLLGITISSLVLSRARPVLLQGRAYMLAYANSFVVMSAMHFALPYAWLIALVFCWGLTGGLGATLSRSIVQAAAPDAYRARVLSLFQFGQVWGGPLGAIIMGFCAHSFGIRNAMLVPAAVTGLLWLGFFFLTPMWRFQRDDALPASAS